MKNTPLLKKALLIIFFPIMTIQVYGQQLCLEERNGDDAIIKDVFLKDGEFYLTVDVVQIIEDEDGHDSIKNENSKLRTFLIDPDTEWNFCIIEGDPQQFTEMVIKVRDLVKRQDLFLDAFVNYSAKAGRILSSRRFGCVG